MYKVLIGVKILLYSWVFIRVFEKPPISLPLVLTALALLVCDFWRSFYRYTRSKVNIVTLLLNLILAILFSLISKSGNFDKLFVIYLAEGTAILPHPLFISYALLTAMVSLGSFALYDFRVSGEMHLPGIAELLMIGFVFIMVFTERRQREQRLAYEKQTKELGFVNLQLKESMALSENLAAEAERRQIVGELHDSLGYHLTGLILTLEAGKKLMNHDVDVAKAYLDKGLQISRTAIQSVRELVSAKKELNFEFELHSRLKEMVREVQSLTGLKIDLDISIQDIGLSGQEQFNMYRIFQEAITNTLRHANADRVHLSISGNQELLNFSYWDNGSGTNRIQAGNGLKGMNNRISSIGGTVAFQSETGKGFKIEGCIDRRGKDNG